MALENPTRCRSQDGHRRLCEVREESGRSIRASSHEPCQSSYFRVLKLRRKRFCDEADGQGVGGACVCCLTPSLPWIVERIWPFRRRRVSIVVPI